MDLLNLARIYLNIVPFAAASMVSATSSDVKRKPGGSPAYPATGISIWKSFEAFYLRSDDYEPDKKTAITAEYNYTKGKTMGNNTYVPSVGGKMFQLPPNFAIATAGTDRVIASDNYFRLHVTHNFNNDWHLNAKLAYMRGYVLAHKLNSNDNLSISNDTLYRAFNFDDWRNSSAVAQVSVDWKFQMSRRIEHTFLIGIDYNNSKISDLTNVPVPVDREEFGLYLPDPDYYVNPDSLRNFETDTIAKWHYEWAALYLQDDIKIADKLLITIAGHFTHLDMHLSHTGEPGYQKKTYYNVFTPRIGLTWLFSNEVSAYTLYDQSFVPQVGRNLENKGFEPLTGFNIETGLKGYFFNKNLVLNCSVFHIVKNHTLTTNLSNPGYSIQRGQIISGGVDFDMTGKIIATLSINANYEYCNAKITKDTDPSFIGVRNFGAPAHSGNIW
ncbi:MAG: TonB-dependent receptor, partial [Ginsengibacter sp.]